MSVMRWPSGVPDSRRPSATSPAPLRLLTRLHEIESAATQLELLMHPAAIKLPPGGNATHARQLVG